MIFLIDTQMCGESNHKPKYEDNKPSTGDLYCFIYAVIRTVKVPHFL